MKIHVCKCRQCRTRKRAWKAKNRRFFRRMTSKARRRMRVGEVKNFYPA